VSEVSIRRATRDDLDFLVGIFAHDDVRPFLAGAAVFDHETLRADLERQDREPDAFGRFLVEVGGEPAGTLSFERANRRSMIARCGALAIDPRFRGRHIGGDAARLFQRHLIFELGYHRLEMVVYGFNERAQRHAERAGWIKEGVKRKAYRREDGWVDGIMYGIVREDLEGLSMLEDHVQRFNAGVRSGDFSSMLDNFREDATMAFEGVPVGPFEGRNAIAQAYREQPPDDQLDILDTRREGETFVAGYAWRRQPDRRAGELRLTVDGDRISRLVVTFD
jgi:steroid delta-isomerase